jgi:exopolysaccharide biosynthesis polyprenyl glycosylphosphotransferase
MEPDILATPGQSSSRPSSWPAHASSAAPPAPPALHSAATPVETVNGAAQASPARVLPLPIHTNGHAARAADRIGLAALAQAGAADARRIELPPADTLYLRYGKRALDVAGALIALVATAPLMLVMAVIIKLESRGPVLYKSQRVGRGGRPFTFYKLRSMQVGAEARRAAFAHLNECDGPVFKISNDPRVTRVGRFMRRTSIDEIPQFLNVLKGEMSMVGPRPPIPGEVAHYEPWQLKRLSVRPGLTCLWQISGRSRIGFDEWMRLDLQYIRRQSFWMDLKILLRTIPAVLSRDGAY